VLTSAALCYIGVICGRIIVYYPEATARVKRWFIWCVIWGIIGGSFCEFKQNGGLIPINKNLWSLTFVTTLACFAFFVMIILYLIIDVKKIWEGYPFRSMGKNSIVVYFASEMLSNAFPFNVTFYADEKPTHMELYFNVYSTVTFMIIAGYMDYINFYIAL
jgi:heparan-alpha-glucosaminide N-acetyltransferase